MTWGEAVALAEGWAQRAQLPLMSVLTIGEACKMLELAGELDDACELREIAKIEAVSEPVEWRW